MSLYSWCEDGYMLYIYSVYYYRYIYIYIYNKGYTIHANGGR